MTWGNDETGMVVIPGSGKRKKTKAPKPAKAKKRAKDRAHEPARYAPPVVPIGLPIAPPTSSTRPSSWPAATSRHMAEPHPGGGGWLRVLRVLGFAVLTLLIAGGGFAAGALTELGTEAETLVLGPTPPPTPVVDPRVPALEAELAQAKADLALLRADQERAAEAAKAQASVAPATPPRPEAQRDHARHGRHHRAR